MAVYIKVGGAWKETTAQKLKSLGGAWSTTMDNIHVKIGGTWYPCLPVFGVTLLANGDTNVRAGSCTCGIKFSSDGHEYEHTSTGGFGSSVNQWLDGGWAGDAWIEFTRTAGATKFDNKSNGTRYNLASDQTFTLNSGGSGYVSITGYFRAYDASSGGNLLATSSSATWAATDTTV